MEGSRDSDEYVMASLKKTVNAQQTKPSPFLYPIETILLAEFNRLLPPVVPLVEIGGNATEFEKSVFFETLGESDIVEVVKGVDGIAHALVVFLVDEKTVQRLVDRLVVEILNGSKVGLDERQLIRSNEERDGARVIETRRQDEKKIVDKQGLVVEIELEGAIVDLDVGHFGDYVLELGFLPSVGRMRYHCHDSIVVLFVFVIEEDQF